MIVVDTNILAYLLIPGVHNTAACALLEHDADWAAPRLWRSEFGNVLSTYVRRNLLDTSTAYALFQRAQSIIGIHEYEVSAYDVLNLAKRSGCSGYDCEFVALAEFLDIPLITADAKLAKAFPTRCSLFQSASL